MNPNTEIKKPLRARKTMTPSSRKQMEILSKLKSPQEPQRTANCISSEDNHGHFEMVETNCLNHNSQKELYPTQLGQLSPTVLKEPVTKLVVSSEISIYNDCREVPQDFSSKNSSTDPDVSQILNPGALKDMIKKLYEKNSSFPLFKPAEECLNLAPPTSHLSDCLEESASSVIVSPSKVLVLDKVKERTEGSQDNLLGIETQQAPCTSYPLPPDRRKKRTSESDEDVHCKHLRTSEESDSGSLGSEKRISGLEKVKHFIQAQLDVAVGDLDKNLQHLSERIDRTQCLQKHEGISIKIVKKISRLDRRVNAVIAFRKTELSKKADLPSAHSQNRVLNWSQPLLLGGGSSQSARSTKAPSTHSKALSKTVVSCGVISLDDNQTSDMQSVDVTDVQQKEASTNADAPVETPTNTQSILLIDLTEEGSSAAKECTEEKEKKRASDKADSAPESLNPAPPLPALQSAKQVPERFPHLPPLPRIRLHPEHMDGFKGTFPPQKLQLAVAQVQNPKGIALQWNVDKVDPRCAPIESFHLFVCLESATNGTLSSWIRTNEIQALPLPMACSLSQFPNSGRCYFTMQSKDIYGRYGPFCDIGSISAV